MLQLHHMAEDCFEAHGNDDQVRIWAADAQQLEAILAELGAIDAPGVDAWGLLQPESHAEAGVIARQLDRAAASVTRAQLVDAEVNGGGELSA